MSYPTHRLLNGESRFHSDANPSQVLSLLITLFFSLFFFSQHPEDKISFIVGQRGCVLLSVNGYRYVKNRMSSTRTYWICRKKGSGGCRARITTVPNGESNLPKVVLFTGVHSHPKESTDSERSAIHLPTKFDDASAVCESSAASVDPDTVKSLITVAKREKRKSYKSFYSDGQ